MSLCCRQETTETPEDVAIGKDRYKLRRTGRAGNEDGSKITLVRKNFAEHVQHFYKTRLFPLFMSAVTIAFYMMQVRRQTMSCLFVSSAFKLVSTGLT